MLHKFPGKKRNDVSVRRLVHCGKHGHVIVSSITSHIPEPLPSVFATMLVLWNFPSLFHTISNYYLQRTVMFILSFHPATVVSAFTRSMAEVGSWCCRRLRLF